MNSERNIIMKLKESKQLDEKTYTVGNTQYWKRNGKFYSWTSTGGRKEVSKNEYMKAMGQARSGMGSVQDTEPHEDKAKEINSPDPNLGKTVKLSGSRMGTIKTMDDLSVEEKREGTFGTVTIKGVKYDVYDSLWANGFASLVRHEEEPKRSSADMVQDIFKSTKYTNDEELASAIETRINSGEESVGHDYSLDWYEITDVEHFTHNVLGPQVRIKVKARGIDYETDKHFEMDTEISTASTKVDEPSISKKDSDKGSKPALVRPPKPEEPKKEERPSWDDTESDYISYKDIKRFDHTSWDIDGYETTITKRPGGGYRLENEDYDEEFETKGDLVRYLKDKDAEYVGQDSENDY